MRPARAIALAGLCALLGGCLEVDQHPVWVKGEIAGKPDNLPYQVRFHNDKLAWSAAIQDRTLKQNEYIRANP
jgi:hypothetical protein